VIPGEISVQHCSVTKHLLQEYSVTLLNSNHLLYFQRECSMMLFLMQSICSGGFKDNCHMTKYGKESRDTNAK
jgi:hypothetical protein